jgi:leucyl-tRNA synthetase
LISNDLVEERVSSGVDGISLKYFHKETGEELEKIVAKMSKSLKNVVNPDEIVQKY